MRFLLTVVALISFVIYGYAIQRIFSHAHGVAWQMRVLQAAGTLFAILHLWCIGSDNAIGVARDSVALLAYVLALAVFFAAKHSLQGYRLTLAFSDDVPLNLLDCGVYARIRHPFYLSYSLTWIAGSVAAPSPFTIGSTTMMVAFYIAAAKLEERKFASTPLAAAYDAYKLRAGLLWPRI